MDDCFAENVFILSIGTGVRWLLTLETVFVIFLCFASTLLGSMEDIDMGTDQVDDTGYLVYSPSCRIPDIPPFHESIKSIYEKLKDAPCNSLPLLTSMSRTVDGHVLHLHKEHLRLYSGENPTTCSYRRVWRIDEPPSNNSEPDNAYNYGEWIEFYSDVTFDRTDEFIHVRCVTRKEWKLWTLVSIGEETDVVYTNLHAFVGLKPEVEAKINEAPRRWENGEKPLSVMILGFDSISRLNMIRTLPKTVEYLDRTGWISLKGYNKIADNTLPNLMAMLAGLTMPQVTQACWPTIAAPLDACPIIWKNFSEQGYITAYAEDTPFISTFNYHKAGFAKSPTDYYLRPFMLAAYENPNGQQVRLKKSLISCLISWLRGDKKRHPQRPRWISKVRQAYYIGQRYKRLNECLGPFTATDHIFNYSLEFAVTFQKHSTFSLFWFNGFSHNDINTPTMMDEHVKNYFKKLKATGALNTTMVIFLSDHGIRFGKIRETYVGYMEERLPFIYFWLPEWFRTAYPAKVENLTKNANRLTSPYDVHMTLADVLGVQTEAKGCPKCISLFQEVPWNRACIDAGITDHWCTCADYKTISTEAAPTQAIAEFIVGEINNILSNYTNFLQNGWQCAPLKLKKVRFISSRVFMKLSYRQKFLIVIQTSPGNALFEATVSQRNTSFSVDTDGISRINSYSGEDECMPYPFAEKYCFCEKLIEFGAKSSATGLSDLLRSIWNYLVKFASRLKLPF